VGVLPLHDHAVVTLECAHAQRDGPELVLLVRLLNLRQHFRLAVLPTLVHVVRHRHYRLHKTEHLLLVRGFLLELLEGDGLGSGLRGRLGMTLVEGVASLLCFGLGLQHLH